MSQEEQKNDSKDTSESTSQQAFNEVNEAEKTELSTKQAYFASLNDWVKQANLSQNAMAMFPWYLLSSYPQLFQQQQQPQRNWQSALNGGLQLNNNNNNNINATNFNRPQAANGNRRERRVIIFQYQLMDDQAQAEFIQRNGGYEYTIAPFWKRAVAEVIDMLILLLLKIIITFTVINLFDLDLGLEIDKDTLSKVFEEDAGNIFAISFDLFVFSTDLLLLEIMTKLMVCLYEALLTALFDGATLGKAAMGLRIKYIEAMLPLPPLEQPQAPPRGLQFALPAQRTPMRALLFPAETPRLQRSLVRAFAKNMIMTLLFPMCFILIFFKHNRTIYDVVTKTVVVEHNAQPVLRRP